MTAKKVPAAKAAFGSLLIAVLTLGMAFTPASAATRVDSDTVRVERGDTLTGIARDFLGDASRSDEIADLNDLADADVIRVGQTLDLPEDNDQDVTNDGNTSSGTSGSTSSSTTISVSSSDDEDDDNDLTDLFILEQLFNDDGMSSGGTSMSCGSDFTDLIILDEVVNDDNEDTSDDDGILGDNSNLVDLFILDELFSDNGMSTSSDSTASCDGNRNFMDLIILDEVLNNDDGDGILSNDDDDGNDFVDLFIINQLFEDGSMMNSSSSNKDTQMKTETKTETNQNTNNQ